MQPSVSGEGRPRSPRSSVQRQKAWSRVRGGYEASLSSGASLAVPARKARLDSPCSSSSRTAAAKPSSCGCHPQMARPVAPSRTISCSAPALAGTEARPLGARPGGRVRPAVHPAVRVRWKWRCRRSDAPGGGRLLPGSTRHVHRRSAGVLVDRGLGARRWHRPRQPRLGAVRLGERGALLPAYSGGRRVAAGTDARLRAVRRCGGLVCTHRRGTRRVEGAGGAGGER